MKKVGIITMHRIQNYGSALQAYALQTVICRLGYECRIIDYVFPNAYHLAGTRRKLTVGRIYRALVSRILMKIFYRSKEQTALFSDFRKDKFMVTDTYNTRDDLFGKPPVFDLYVTGSDQVWNPKHMKGDSAFFCDFIRNGAKRIAYAASISSNYLSGQEELSYGSLLGKYSAIGVRENDSVEYIGKLAKMQACCVCDPTLLLNKQDYLELAECSRMKIKQPFILVYTLGYNFNPHPMIDGVIDAVRKKYNCPVVYLRCNNLEGLGKGRGSYRVSAAGPNEFVWLFANARCVVTSSFHGSIFSLLFEKQFVSVSSSADNRIPSLLQYLQLGDRLETSEKRAEFEREIDYNEVNPLMEKMKVASLEFLKKSIEDNIL